MSNKVISNRFRELLAAKERRDKRRYSRQEIADATGLSRGTLDSYSRNAVTRFDSHVVLALCDFLGCSLDEFFVVDEAAPDIKTPLLLPA